MQHQGDDHLWLGGRALRGDDAVRGGIRPRLCGHLGSALLACGCHPSEGLPFDLSLRSLDDQEPFK